MLNLELSRPVEAITGNPRRGADEQTEGDEEEQRQVQGERSWGEKQESKCTSTHVQDFGQQPSSCLAMGGQICTSPGLPPYQRFMFPDPPRNTIIHEKLVHILAMPGPRPFPWSVSLCEGRSIGWTGSYRIGTGPDRNQHTAALVGSLSLFFCCCCFAFFLSG